MIRHTICTIACSTVSRSSENSTRYITRPGAGWSYEGPHTSAGRYLNRLWDGVLPGLAYGAWLFFALNSVELAIFGMNVYLLRKILILDYVRHTHLKISFGPWLSNIILCRSYHQLHHSRDSRHYNRNFGFVFTVRDQVFGTLAAPAPNGRTIFRPNLNSCGAVWVDFGP